MALPVGPHRRGLERGSFVGGAPRRGGHEVFSSIVSPTQAAQVERQRKRAGGLPIRSNPPRTYVRPWQARSQRQPALRLPGAAAALEQEDSTALDPIRQRPQLILTAPAALGLVGLTRRRAA